LANPRNLRTAAEASTAPRRKIERSLRLRDAADATKHDPIHPHALQRFRNE
jgi:hypothetical protein